MSEIFFIIENIILLTQQISSGKKFGIWKFEIFQPDYYIIFIKNRLNKNILINSFTCIKRLFDTSFFILFVMSFTYPLLAQLAGCASCAPFGAQFADLSI